MNKEKLQPQEQMIQNKWKSRMCPIVNGIMFGNGKIVELEADKFEGITLHPQIQRITSIETFVLEHGDYWTSLDELCGFDLLSRNLRITGGEGGFGGDGFVALSHSSDDQLIWIAFFEDSNPFIQVSTNNDESVVIGITTLETVWQFPIDQPEKPKVYKAERDK